MFANTPRGADASSVIYSIIETAKENGLHPYQYLKFLLETLPNTPDSKLEPLLPWSGALTQVRKQVVRLKSWVKPGGR